MKEENVIVRLSNGEFKVGTIYHYSMDIFKKPLFNDGFWYHENFTPLLKITNIRYK